MMTRAYWLHRQLLWLLYATFCFVITKQVNNLSYELGYHPFSSDDFCFCISSIDDSYKRVKYNACSTTDPLSMSFIFQTFIWGPLHSQFTDLEDTPLGVHPAASQVPNHVLLCGDQSRRRMTPSRDIVASNLRS